VFEQWAVLEHFREMSLPAGLDRLKQWWQAVADRESVRSFATSSEFYVKRYAQFAQAKTV
jgi:glutathione S-transferase